MIARILLTRAALVVVAAASFTILTGCECKPGPDANKPAAIDGKDAGKGLMKTSGPHQGS